MDNNKYHIYNSGDIQRYLGGQMTAPEMNAFEKAALDDPFLAEALEGYESMQHADWEKQLDQVKKDFIEEENKNDHKVVAFSRPKNNWWKYAAAIVILGGGITTYFILDNKSDNNTRQPVVVAKVDTTVVAQPVTHSADSITGKITSTAITLPEKKMFPPDSFRYASPDQKGKTIAADPASPGYLANAEEKKSNTFKIQDSLQNKMTLHDLAKTKELDQTSKPGRSLADSTRMLDKNNMSNFYANSQPRGPLLNQQNINSTNGYTNTSGITMKKKDPESNKTFFAQVMGPDNTPLPFANINVTNQGFGTYADVKGNVRLVSTDSTIPVEIKSLGYATQYVTLHNNNPNKIILREDAFAANEKLERSATAPSTARVYRKYVPSQDSTNAEPADGWDNYNTYVLNNLEIPDEVLNKNLHGEVEISFDVKRNGAVTNVKVDKSLCNDCDEIAKRLVEQGPQWKVKKGKKAKAKVKVQF
ncbi:MAG: carboxypeptidase-like regulatory domain-containing protein [Ferruginibacter sp.]